MGTSLNSAAKCRAVTRSGRTRLRRVERQKEDFFFVRRAVRVDMSEAQTDSSSLSRGWQFTFSRICLRVRVVGCVVSGGLKGGVAWVVEPDEYTVSSSCRSSWSTLRAVMDAALPRSFRRAVVEVDSAMLAADEALPPVEQYVSGLL